MTQQNLTIGSLLDDLDLCMSHESEITWPWLAHLNPVTEHLRRSKDVNISTCMCVFTHAVMLCLTQGWVLKNTSLELQSVLTQTKIPYSLMIQPYWINMAHADHYWPKHCVAHGCTSIYICMKCYICVWFCVYIWGITYFSTWSLLFL